MEVSGSVPPPVLLSPDRLPCVFRSRRMLRCMIVCYVLAAWFLCCVPPPATSQTVLSRQARSSAWSSLRELGRDFPKAFLKKKFHHHHHHQLIETIGVPALMIAGHVIPIAIAGFTFGLFVTLAHSPLSPLPVPPLPHAPVGKHPPLQAIQALHPPNKLAWEAAHNIPVITYYGLKPATLIRRKGQREDRLTQTSGYLRQMLQRQRDQVGVNDGGNSYLAVQSLQKLWNSASKPVSSNAVDDGRARGNST
ncbi:uncharacterized protein LOC135366252 [Ornithodoros turicata]|uniref:uncharacterized protein LOC135366252 n=1 Tax=Ornithodoros turicata TaxID=34597 RepID=UPI003138F9D1